MWPGRSCPAAGRAVRGGEGESTMTSSESLLPLSPRCCTPSCCGGSRGRPCQLACPGGPTAASASSSLPSLRLARIIDTSDEQLLAASACSPRARACTATPGTRRTPAAVPPACARCCIPAAGASWRLLAAAPAAEARLMVLAALLSAASVELELERLPCNRSQRAAAVELVLQGQSRQAFYSRQTCTGNGEGAWLLCTSMHAQLLAR